MYRNYLKTAWRNMSRNRLFTAINVSGLSLGLTCSILVGLWVRHEYSIHIDLSWWVFVAAAAGALLIALLTISSQAIRAGLRNPVNSLRSE